MQRCIKQQQSEKQIYLQQESTLVVGGTEGVNCMQM